MFSKKTSRAFLHQAVGFFSGSSTLSASSGLFSAVVIWILLVSGGCDRGLFKKPLGEEAPPKQLQGVRIGFERGCLSEVLPTMAQFMEGTATPESVSANWDCFAQALTTFLENVKGSRSEESFTGREIAGFFEFFFLKDVQISDRLLEEILHLKQLAVGGSGEFITRQELRSLIEFADQMKRVSLKLLPHMRVYALNWRLRGPRSLEEDVDYFEKSAQVLQEVTRELSDRIGSFESTYRLSSFVAMLQELEKIYATKWSFLEAVERGVPLVQKLKAALTGGDEDRIAAREWRRFAVLTARGYVQFLRYYYFVRDSEPANQSTRLVFVSRSIEDLFDFLGDLVREKEQQVFTVEELNQILSKLRDVFPSFYLPPSLVAQAMKVKQLFFGGSRDFWTSDDFDRARNKVMQLRDINQRLVAHADYYSMAWDSQALSRSQQLKESEQAQRELLRFAQDLSSLFETSYDLSDLFVLFSEIEKVFSASLDSSLLKTLKNTVILLVVYKNILFSDNTSRIEKRSDLNQWPLFLTRSLELYALRLQHFYFIEGKEILRGEALLNLQSWSHQVLAFLEALLQGKPKGTLTSKELDRLLAALSTAEVLPKSLVVSDLQSLLRNLLPRLLPPEIRLARPYLQPPDFSLNHFSWLRSEWALWLARQREISQSYHSLPRGAGLWAAHLVRKLEARTEMSELVEMMKVPRALQLERRGRVYLGEREIPLSFEAVSRLNWLMSLIRLSIRSYAGETRRMDPLNPGAGLLREELRELFLTFQPLLVNMGLVARNNMRFVDSRFLEANVFMPRSDGNQILSYFEAVEMGSLIASGLKIDAELKQQIEARCFVVQSQAVALKSVNTPCVMDVYRDEVQLALSSAPLFAKYVQNLSRQDFQKLMASILIAAGSANPLRQPIIYRELSLVPHVIQFLESVTTRFDLNRDGILSKEESLASFPLFKDLIRSFPGVDSDSRAYAGFAYILKFGRAPSSTREKLQFLWWSFFPSRWKFQVDRLQLASIFAFIQKCGTSGQQCDEAQLRSFDLSKDDFEKDFPEVMAGLAPVEKSRH